MSGGLYSTEGRDFDQTLDLKKIKPYGDTMNDGKTQLSFTLPVPAGDEAIEAAKQLMKKMGFENPQVVFHQELTKGYTFFNCYGNCVHTVDYSHIYVPKVESTKWDMGETDQFVREHIGRKIVVIGASTGTDAHTVGIDAIMNMKGFAGHYGLELKYTLVAESEADLKTGKISVTSPIGKGLLGKKVGEIAEISVPNGKLNFEILEITRD
jgi:beta-lysine 5,6-aminomutase beta subunit